MSFHWNLSSDEENGFDDWANVDLNNESLASTAAVATNRSSTVVASSSSRRAGNSSGDDENEDDYSSSSDDEDRNVPPSNFAGVAFCNDFDGDQEDDDDDDDDVNWEDAGDKTGGAATSTGANSETPELATDVDASSKSTLSNLRPVTLDWTNKNSKEKSPSSASKTKTKKSAKRVARKRYRFEQLTPDLQYLLSHLEKTHLLSLTAHAIYASRQCSEEESIHIAHSIVPLAWVRAPPAAPTMEDLRSFCNFFFHLVHPTRHQTADMVVHMPRYRRKRGKTKTKTRGKEKGDHQEEKGVNVSTFGDTSIVYRTADYCCFLASSSSTSSDPNLNFNEHDQVQLFLAMTRSLGWRVRYVMALEPCTKDLDVEHPVFVAMSTRNVFQRLWKQSRGTRRTSGITSSTNKEEENGDKKPPPKRAKIEKNVNDVSPMPSKALASSDALLNMLDPALAKRQTPLCWVEILCATTPTRKRAGNTEHHTSKLHWVHLDPIRELIDTPEAVETVLYAKHEGISFSNAKKKHPIPYALAAEHLIVEDGMLKLRLADVTPRYASSFVESLKIRGVVRGKQGPIHEQARADKWWAATLKSINTASHARRAELQVQGKTQEEAIVLGLGDSDEEDRKPGAVDHHIKEVDEHEEKLLHESRQNEPIPTSKTAFKTNPIYTLPSLLNSSEVLKPDAKTRICGIFKGEFVVRRTEVETALAANRWLYKGRKVKESELNKPIKRVKARNKGPSKSFKALKSYGVGQSNDGSEEAREKIIDVASKPLDDGMENLYASWQTNAWSPDPVGPSDPIPANEHNNIELALLNPGLVHIDERHVAKVAKKIGIPYVPCLLGFEGHGGNRTPTIRGIVVHQHNEELLREAHQEMASIFLQEEHENRQRAILLRWKRLLVGVLTKERLDRAYG